MISNLQYQEMLLRTQRNAGRVPVQIGVPVLREIPLHEEIIRYCNNQFPRWKYVHANPVKASTIVSGCQDFTLFLPHQRTICIECKSKDGKLSPAQVVWRKEMELLGHTVHIVRSMDDFLSAVKSS